MRSKAWKTLGVTVLVVIGLAVPAVPATAGQSKFEGTIVIGQLVTETDPSMAGQSFPGFRQTLEAWVKMTNAAGGINNMKIKLISEDDNNDPAKASAAMKSLIDDGAIAIVSPFAAATQSVWMPIATEAGVPVISGGCYSATDNANENFFCVNTTVIPSGLKAQTKWASEQGGKRFGITYNSAQPAAAAASSLFGSFAEDADMEFTDAVPTSLTEPDYTAACVTFKQSDTTDIGLEGAPSLEDLARDCARQGYYPTYSSGDGAIGTRAWLDNDNIEKAIAAVYAFPSVVKKGDTPEQTESLRQFHAAMNKYAPKVFKGDYRQWSTVIWSSAVAFGVAASRVPAGTEYTSQAITDAMNTFEEETLGGLAPNPLTFVAGEEHAPNPCWWGMVVKNHKLTAPNGMETICTP